jgi:dihydropyrimidine dehydrogenase (NAD+) subunit PreA
MVDLSVHFAGLELKNPYGVAPLGLCNPGNRVPEKNANMLMKYVDSGASYVFIHATCSELEHPKNMEPTGRWMKIEVPGFGVLGHLHINDAERNMIRLNPAKKLIKIMKEKLPDNIPLIADLMGGPTPKSWADLAAEVEEAGVDAVELDTSCPCPIGTIADVKGIGEAFIEKKMPEGTEQLRPGLLIGDTLELLEPVTQEVRKAIKIPFGVKLSAETGFPRLLAFAKTLKESGANWITAVNCGVTVSPPNIYDGGKPTWNDLNASTISLTTGPWMRFLCYRDIGTISLAYPEIDLSAVGGLVEPEHHIEAIMLGAKTTQFSSGMFWKGTDNIKRTISFTEKYIKDYGYDKIEDFRGAALKYFKPMKDVDWKFGKIVAVTDYDKCNGCTICAKCGCYAIYMKGGKARTIPEECTGCNLCVTMCPQDARKIIPMDSYQRD